MSGSDVCRPGQTKVAVTVPRWPRKWTIPETGECNWHPRRAARPCFKALRVYGQKGIKRTPTTLAGRNDAIITPTCKLENTLIR